MIILQSASQYSMNQLARSPINDKGQVTRNAIEVKCYSKNTVVLKRFLCRVFSVDIIETYIDNIHFVPWSLRQISSHEIHRRKIVRHNHFLHYIAIIAVFKIEHSITYNTNIPQLKTIPSIKDFKQTHIMDSKKK